MDLARFDKIPGIHRPNIITYLNKEDGESIEVFQDEVMSVTYFPAASESHLRCNNVPKARDDAEQPFSNKLDTYGRLRLADEHARLDNFAIELAQRPMAKGYIVVYTEDEMSAAEARTRAERAKSYLVRVRRIKPNRLVTLSGRPAGQFKVELYIVSLGSTGIHPVKNARSLPLTKNLQPLQRGSEN